MVDVLLKLEIISPQNFSLEQFDSPKTVCKLNVPKIKYFQEKSSFERKWSFFTEYEDKPNDSNVTPFNIQAVPNSPQTRKKFSIDLVTASSSYVVEVENPKKSVNKIEFEEYYTHKIRPTFTNKCKRFFFI